MKTPLLVRAVQFVVVLVTFSIIRALMFVLASSPGSVMESGLSKAARVAYPLSAVAFALFVLYQTIRPGRFARAYVVVFLALAFLASVSSPATRSLIPVLVQGADAYVPPEGLPFPYASQTEVVAGAYASALFHLLAASFIAFVAFGRTSKTYFGGTVQAVRG